MNHVYVTYRLNHITFLITTIMIVHLQLVKLNSSFGAPLAISLCSIILTYKQDSL
jgi:hypothetical protein